MKRLLAFTGCFLIMCIIVSGYTGKNVSGAENGMIQPESQQSESSAENTEGYVISVFAGRVAMFRKSDEKVVLSSDTLVRDLPEKDRAALEKGIEVKSRKEAEKLMYELCS